MSDGFEIWERPEVEVIYMLAGWNQWADAGSLSSGLPQYLIEANKAKHIGRLSSDGYYMFQIPGTHDLVRPIVKFKDGFPKALEVDRNDFYYVEYGKRGLVIFIGDEPHLDVERYANAFLEAAETLGVKRIISLGGVYGEMPYDKERLISSIYSLPELKDELDRLVVNYSDYHGGVSIGSYLCQRASKKDREYVGLFAFVPSYEFPKTDQLSNSIRLENDFTAWLGIMERVNYMTKLNIDLSDLEAKSRKLDDLIDEKVQELDKDAPQLGVSEFFKNLSENYEEKVFSPLDDVWEEEIKRLFDKLDADEPQESDMQI